MLWGLTIVALIGAYLNIRKDRRGFICWIFSNGAWSAVDYHHGLYAQSALFAVYFCLACYGLYEWRNHA